MYEAIELVFDTVVQYGTLLLEIFGVLVLLAGAIRCIIGYISGKKGLLIELAEGISLALMFMMGGEVLCTLIERTWDQLALLGAIILIRAAMTFLLNFEIRMEKSREAKDEKAKDEKAKEEKAKAEAEKNSGK